MLAVERAPELLFNRCGEVHLSWIVTVSQAQYRGRLGLSDQQYHAFVREWKDSEEGRRLLEGLRAGNVEGWPRPPAPGQVQQQQRAQAEQRRQAKAGRRTGAAVAMDVKRQGRGRRSKADGGSDALTDAAEAADSPEQQP
ncbi:hypothetical protein COHA_000545 [Chlorella ohadii]|uniref:Uncharacterized protein n=1 Tax=Chlorella ohadii TaxID=2649997 RepID=A0AAD5H6C8_9CHLO|nr:hypothetical protein COHA_000545 [Chlorella ohadii]